MSILIKSGEEYYEIPAHMLEKCRISKDRFDQGRKTTASDVATQSDVPGSGGGCNLVDLSVGVGE